MQKFYWKGPTGESHQAHGHHDGGGGGLYDYPRYHRVHQPAQTKVNDAPVKSDVLVTQPSTHTTVLSQILPDYP